MITYCDLYLRLSDGRRENGSFADREKALRRKASERNWEVHRVVIENDEQNGSKSASAFKRRRVILPDGRTVMRVWRPGFRSMLNDLASGTVGAILAEDLDRTMRDPRDAEDLIDIVRDRGAYADSLSGSLKFTSGGTDAEVLTARIMVSVAHKSSADTARRVADARERKASKGEFGGGRRPYGFGPDGVTSCGHETGVIQEMADAVLSGQSLRSIARDLRDRGEPTVTGVPWQPTMIKDILLRRRNIGRMTHRGQDAGPAPWGEILTPDVYEGVRARLESPERDSSPGRAPRWLLSGIARCVCGQTLEAHNARSSYRCKALRSGPGGGGHVRRNAPALDDYVSRLVIERLSRHDVVDLVTPKRPGIDVTQLNSESKRLRDRLEDLGAAFAEGEIDRAQLAAGTKRIKAKLAEVTATLATVTDISPLAPVIGVEDIETTWQQLSLGQRRAIVDLLMVITALPTERRPGFREEDIRIEWRS